MRRTRTLVLAAAAALALAACAPVDETPEATTTSTEGELPTRTPGTLTIATSDPAYVPWMVDNDPTNGQGFESAVAYAVASELGFGPDDVTWVRASFEQIIAPGAKSFDFAINQVSISDEREANLDFSSPYYTTTQAVVSLEGNPAATATGLADLKDVRLGAMVGTTSLTVAEETIQPTTPVAAFNDNDQVKQALVAGLVDAIVVDLPTALFITAAELDGGVLVGQLPTDEGGDKFALVLDKGSPLTAPVSDAVDALRADGTLGALVEQWLTASAGAPILN